MFLETLRQWSPQSMEGVGEWRRIPFISGGLCGRHPHRTRHLGKGISIALSAWGGGDPIASGGLWAVQSLLHPVPGGRGNPSCIQHRGRGRSLLLLGALRVALPRGAPSRLHPRGALGGGRAWLPRPAPSLPPGGLPWDAPAALGLAPRRRAGVKGSSGGRDASAGRARRLRLSGQRRPRGDPHPAPPAPWRGGRRSAASRRRRPPRSCSCP